MSKIVLVGLAVAAVATPLVVGGVMLSNKYNEIDRKVNSSVNYLNQTGLFNARASINKGLFESEGKYSIELKNTDKTVFDIDFRIRHGIETIFNSPIVITSQGTISTPNAQLKNSFSAKTKYYGFYSYTEYDLDGFKYKINNDDLYIGGLKGGFNYTEDKNESEYFFKTYTITIKNGEQVKFSAKELTSQLVVRNENLFEGKGSLDIKEMTVGGTSYNAFSFGLQNEKGLDPQSTNINIKASSNFANASSGPSSYNTKATITLPDQTAKDFSSSIATSIIAKSDANTDKKIAETIVSLIKNGFAVDLQQTINTTNLGTYNLSLTSKIDKSENPAGWSEKLKANGMFSHVGPYATYMYDTAQALGTPLARSKQDTFATNFSYEHGQAFLSSIEIDPMKYISLISEIVKSIATK